MPLDTREVQLAVGRRIKELRQKRKLTQQAVADATGMLASNYARLERGSSNMTLDTLVRIANVLEVRIAELFVFSTAPLLDRLPVRERAPVTNRVRKSRPRST